MGTMQIRYTTRATLSYTKYLYICFAKYTRCSFAHKSNGGCQRWWLHKAQDFDTEVHMWLP